MEETALNLTFSWLLLLPAIAVILICLGAWKYNRKRALGRPNTPGLLSRAMFMLHWALTASLLLATLIVFMTPPNQLPDLVNGLLLTAMLMVPILVYLSIVRFRSSLRKASSSQSRAYSFSSEQGRQGSAAQTRTASEFAREVFASDNTVRATGQEILPAKTYGELIKLVASLQKEKMKLQKLVIAQRSAMDIETQGNQKTPVTRQNTLELLRKSREAARVAIRVAQSERRERLRLESANAEIRRQSENA